MCFFFSCNKIKCIQALPKIFKLFILNYIYPLLSKYREGKHYRSSQKGFKQKYVFLISSYIHIIYIINVQSAYILLVPHFHNRFDINIDLNLFALFWKARTIDYYKDNNKNGAIRIIQKKNKINEKIKQRDKEYIGRVIGRVISIKITIEKSPLYLTNFLGKKILLNLGIPIIYSTIHTYYIYISYTNILYIYPNTFIQ